MKKVEFRCKVITPMFMGGANKNEVELRPTEFKGMMRFWWRAIKAEDNIERLKKEENEIFGGTGRDEGKSKVVINLIPLNLIESCYWPLPHKRNFKSKCYFPFSEFQIKLIITDFEYENMIKNLFILTTILGGFGKRSRRGFGSIEIQEYKDLLEINKLCEILNQIENSYEIKNSKIVSKKRGSNYPWIKEIEIGSKEYEHWKKIVEQIGMASHKFKDNSLGSANPRLASPIYVSVISKEDKYFPIITTLHHPEFINTESQKKFKKAILNKEEIKL